MGFLPNGYLIFFFVLSSALCTLCCHTAPPLGCTTLHHHTTTMTTTTHSVSFPSLVLPFDAKSGGIATVAPTDGRSAWFVGGSGASAPPAWRLEFLSGASLVQATRRHPASLEPHRAPRYRQGSIYLTWFAAVGEYPLTRLAVFYVDGLSVAWCECVCVCVCVCVCARVCTCETALPRQSP